MADAEKMRAVIVKIKEDPSKWNQRYFSCDSDCGTQHCFASWAIVLDGWQYGGMGWMKLGFATRLSSESLAQEILELTDDEVDELFYTMECDITEYEKLVEEVIAGSLEDS